MSRFLVALAAACVFLAVALPGAASAELIYYVEDFEHNGGPGFDPMFNHEFTSPFGLPSLPSYWELRSAPHSPPSYGMALALAPAEDAISFSIPSAHEVVHASVHAQIWSSGGSENSSVDFIGLDGTLRFLLTGPGAWQRVEATSDQIGRIHEIRIRSSEGFFDNITIGIRAVPEPSMLLLLLTMLVSCSRGIFRRV